jgi:glycerophosphoryl diester phosphodiesterase
VNRARFAFLEHDGPIAFAHRGGALEAPENTWKSFTHARDLGYRYMETDVHATKDGVVVTIHDPDLTRVSEHKGVVREMSWKHLTEVRLTGDEPVPRLDELLTAWPEVKWNLDAKHDSVVGPLLETIHRTGAQDRVCITSFNDRRLARLRRALGPKACMTLGPGATTVLRLSSWLPDRVGERMTGRLRGFAAAQVPLYQWRIPVVDRKFVESVHEAGLVVHVWTIDDEETMSRLLDLGVDGLMTDRPTVLRDLLMRRRAWP